MQKWMRRDPEAKAFSAIKGLWPTVGALFHGDWAFAGLMNTAVTLFILAVIRPTPIAADDLGIAGMLVGVYGDPSPFGVITSVFFTWPVYWLQQLLPGINVFNLAQTLGCLASFTAICGCFQKMHPGFAGRVVSVLTALVIAPPFYINMQYTKTAALLTCCGFLLLFYLLEQSANGCRPKVWAYLGTAFFILEGTFLRFYAAIMILPVLLCVGLALPWSQKGRTAGQRLKRTGRLAILAVATFAVMLGADFANTAICESEIPGVLAYNTQRGRINDYPLQAYTEATAAQYQALGFSENDILLARQWTLNDFKVFSNEALEKLYAMAKHHTFSAADCLADTMSALSARPLYFLLWCIAGFSLLLASLRSKLLTLLLLAVIHGESFWFAARGRFPERVADSILAVAVLCALWLFAASVLRFNGQRALAAAAIGFLCVSGIGLDGDGLLTAFRQRATGAMSTDSSSVEFYTELASRSENVYMLSLQCGSPLATKAFTLLQGIPARYKQNVIPLGGWGTKTPSFQQQLETYGLNNPIENLTNDNVYLLVGQQYGADTLQTFLREHYEPSTAYSLQEILNGMAIYKYTVNFDSSWTLNRTFTLEPLQVDIINQENYYRIETSASWAADMADWETYIEITDKTTNQIHTYPGTTQLIVEGDLLCAGPDNLAVWLPASALNNEIQNYEVCLLLRSKSNGLVYRTQQRCTLHW